MQQNRAYIWRVKRIIDIISQGPANQAELAEALDVSIRTISRDMDSMRSDLDMPLEYDIKTRAWYLAGPVPSIFSSAE